MSDGSAAGKQPLPAMPKPEQAYRVADHPVLGRMSVVEPVRFFFNGQSVEGRPGDVIASALMAMGIRTLRHSERRGHPRGIYCAIGHCYDCRVTVNGRPGVRACTTRIEEGMRVEGGTLLPRRGGGDR